MGAMTPEEFEKAMQEIADAFSDWNSDMEGLHVRADDLMCIMLKELGYSKGIDIYKKIQHQFWYS